MKMSATVCVLQTLLNSMCKAALHMLYNVCLYRMSNGVHSEIDGQQAENLVSQQNTSQIQIQPNVSYGASTAAGNYEYVTSHKNFIIIIIIIFMQYQERCL